MKINEIDTDYILILMFVLSTIIGILLGTEKNWFAMIGWFCCSIVIVLFLYDIK